MKKDACYLLADVSIAGNVAMLLTLPYVDGVEWEAIHG
jgi:hypothetical protein